MRRCSWHSRPHGRSTRCSEPSCATYIPRMLACLRAAERRQALVPVRRGRRVGDTAQEFRHSAWIVGARLVKVGNLLPKPGDAHPSLKPTYAQRFFASDPAENVTAPSHAMICALSRRRRAMRRGSGRHNPPPDRTLSHEIPLGASRALLGVRVYE